MSGDLSALTPRVVAKDRPAAVSMRRCGTSLEPGISEYCCAISHSENVLGGRFNYEF
jgi:hypothetical protein